MTDDHETDGIERVKREDLRSLFAAAGKEKVEQ
jgi:hypothetical protein